MTPEQMIAVETVFFDPIEYKEELAKVTQAEAESKEEPSC